MTTSIHRTIRSPLTAADMKAIQPNPYWIDGRYDAEFARFDAIVDATRGDRAEITWDDDADFDDNEARESRLYFDPILRLETNRRDDEDHDHLITVDIFDIEIDSATAIALVMGDPANVLKLYAKEFAGMKR